MWRTLARARSPFCLGLDPSAELVADWGLAGGAAGLERFCRRVLEAADGRVSVVKPQSAFFERLGPPGYAVLAKVIGEVRAQGSLCLLDAKRGDIGSTMEAYAEATLGGGLAADAVTASAYLGFAPLQPLCARAWQTGAAVFVVVRSSNSEGRPLQDACLADGRTVADALADEITAWNDATGQTPGPVGAVMGATLDPLALATLERLPNALILAPGVGAQGATFADVAQRFGAAVERTLPSASRQVLRAGPDRGALRDAIERCREEAWAMAGHPAAA